MILLINDLILIIINYFNFKELIKNLAVKLDNVFIKNIKYNCKRIKINYLIRIKITINLINKNNNKVIL